MIVDVIIEKFSENDYLASMINDNVWYGLIGEGETLDEVKVDLERNYNEIKKDSLDANETFTELTFNYIEVTE